MISSYLEGTSKLDDNAVHLLFSANWWEKRALMEATLQARTTLVVDRYSYSGVAFTAAKGLGLEWCKAQDKGLPAADLVLDVGISPEVAAQRGEYGQEHYENVEFQKKVALCYQAFNLAASGCFPAFGCGAGSDNRSFSREHVFLALCLDHSSTWGERGSRGTLETTRPSEASIMTSTKWCVSQIWAHSMGSHVRSSAFTVSSA
ncbi:unnamed protein product [Calypogeia fissa]